MAVVVAAVFIYSMPGYNCTVKRLAVVVVAVFIYSMPGYNCTIKERMLYSTCKAPLLEVAEQQIGLDIGRKV